jgi:hypothetical protein
MQKMTRNNKQEHVYVQDIDGIPLMPTKRFRKVRLLIVKPRLFPTTLLPLKCVIM